MRYELHARPSLYFSEPAYVFHLAIMGNGCDRQSLLNSLYAEPVGDELRRKFAKDLYPALGSKVISSISEHDLRNLVRSVIARGATRQAISLFSDIVQMFGWAQKRQPWRTLLIDENPADLVEINKLVPSDYQEERTRILSSIELQKLYQRFQKMTADYAALPAAEKYDGIRPLKPESQLALWTCLGTLCRIGELLQAEWKNVDLENGVWFIPVANVKGSRGKKQYHHMFLSAFAIHYFSKFRLLTGNSQWCFPAKHHDGHIDLKVVSKQVGDRQSRFKNRKPLSRRRHDDTLVLSGGANGEWTPHDLRRTGATMMQALGISLDVIDRCQNHVLAGSRVRRHYLHHDYAKEKKEAWNLLGEKLTDIMIGQDGLEGLGRGNSNGHKAPMTTYASTTGKLNPNESTSERQ
ncbi:tyrosine-type recombinase/integrase [Pseudomonas extremaustralis]|uniref:tyrosine-type recombinase/integrase n=1 Tax=Pseudomonas extremaustralis TaxID=359110 RepID=UPI0023DFE631|nr:tyrosine-type recombinase/integrase [Pseudomonas extremaustralis]MDF3133505.1 tyrosine-type recombinase/integrase [Pseudomonas extremaustralis]